MPRIPRVIDYLAVSPSELSQLGRLVDPEFHPNHLESNSEQLADFVLALYGRRVLENQDIRRLVFEAIDPATLQRIARARGGKTYPKHSDTALYLAGRPWRAGSRLVYEVASALAIGWEFLPAAMPRRPSVEHIEPIEQLPALHSFQQEAKDEVVAALRQRLRGVLVQLPTGAGKTRTVLEAVIDHFLERKLFESGRSVLWLAHTEELCEQAIDTFKDIWQQKGVGTMRAVRFWGGHDVHELDWRGSFVVSGVSKLWSCIRNRDKRLTAFSSVVETVIVDEAHKALAPTYRACLDRFGDREGVTAIGLTATPGRSLEREDENISLAKMFGRRLIAPDLGPRPIEELRQRKILAKLERRTVESKLDFQLAASELSATHEELDFPATLLARMAESVPRNRTIVRVVTDEIGRGNPCIVFSCGVKHSRLLAGALNLGGCRSAAVDCNMDRGARRRAVEGFRQGELEVLVNFGVLSTGFDAPRTKAIIIARPTSSVVLYSQMIGRGLRGPLMGGSETCELVDIKDNFSNFGDMEEVYGAFTPYWS